MDLESGCSDASGTRRQAPPGGIAVAGTSWAHPQDVCAAPPDTLFNVGVLDGHCLQTGSRCSGGLEIRKCHGGGVQAAYRNSDDKVEMYAALEIHLGLYHARGRYMNGSLHTNMSRKRGDRTRVAVHWPNMHTISMHTCIEIVHM